MATLDDLPPPAAGQAQGGLRRVWTGREVGESFLGKPQVT